MREIPFPPSTNFRLALSTPNLIQFQTMKKALYFLMCSAVGLGAFTLNASESVISSIGFNNPKLWGKTPAYGLGDDGNSPSDLGYFWYYTGADSSGNESRMRAYATNSVGAVIEPRYDSFDNVRNVRPEYMSDVSTNSGVMRVVSSGVLQRSFRPIASSSGIQRDSYVDVPETGLYIDMLFKAELGLTILPDPAQCMARGTKIGFGIRPDRRFSTGYAITVVAGGIADGRLYATNYATSVSVTTGAWYRITGRMFANASSNPDQVIPAFVLYLNGTALTCSEDEYDAIGLDAESYFGANPYYVSRSLFPSLQKRGGTRYADKAYGLGFTGNGYVDEIGVTTTNLFAQPSATIDFVVRCENAAVASVAYEASVEGEVYAQGTFTGAISGSRIPAKTGAKIVLSPIAKEGFVLGEALQLSGNTAAVRSVSGFTVDMAGGATFADSEPVIASIPSTASNFEVAGVSYALFADAVKAVAAADGLVKVAGDVLLDGASERWDRNGQARVLPSQKVILDLNGKRIKGDHFNNEAAIYNQGSLTVVDSVGGGIIEAAGTVIENDYGEVSTNTAAEVNRASAALTLGSETSRMFAVRGRVKRTQGKLTIETGDYLTPADEDPSTFYLAAYVDTARFTIAPVEEDPSRWTVTRNDMLTVKFVTSNGKGKVVPARASVAPGGTVSAPTLEAPGYAFLGWYAEGSEEPFDFGTPITADMTVVARLKLEEYEIVNDQFLFYDEEIDFPTNYTVESAYRVLPEPVRSHFTFAGWFRRGTDLQVTAVGAGAKFVGTDNVVTGDLDLVSAWVSEPFVWRNTDLKLEEANGTYAGVWSLKLPSRTGLETGTPMKIDEIDFCIVNPTQYPKTSPYLAIQNDAGDVYVSRRRNDFDPGAGGAYAGYGTLANGRAKVAYVFEGGVPVKMGFENKVFFCSDGTGTQGRGFLRLVYPIVSDHRVIGTCATDPESAPDVKYGNFCPAYEIIGEAVP